MIVKRLRAWQVPCMVLSLALVTPLTFGAFNSTATPHEQAQQHEKNGEWTKAIAIYESLLRQQRSPELQARYQSCLRRFWQTLRHQDIGYRKEVLGLDYGQSLRLYNKIRDTLLDHALDRKKADAGRLLHKGIQELDAALSDPFFVQSYLPGKAAEAQAFREYIKKKWGKSVSLTRVQAEKQIRDIALEAQDILQLQTTVTILELACGACYAFDDYTAYLTPSQFRDLYDALKGESSEGILQSVIAEMKTQDIAYVRIAFFQETTPQELDNALAAVQAWGVKGIVLDLRGNPGGLLEVAVDASRKFLSSGIIVAVENQDPRYSTVHQARTMAPCLLPMVVLIDGDTASAAEVLAGALHDNERARLVGQTTFGKGCSQQLVKLPAASGVPTGGLRLTIARFFSPKGVCYTGRGIVPDILADRVKPEAPEVDNQLQEAVADLSRQLALR